MDNLTLRRFVWDIDIRSQLIGRTLHEPLAQPLPEGNCSRGSALLLDEIMVILETYLCGMAVS